MKKKKNNPDQKPEIYAINKDGKIGPFERRDFLKGLGLLAGTSLLGCTKNLKVDDPGFITQAFGEEASLAEKIDAEECDKLKAHANDVKALAKSPNGKMLASASDDKTIKLWSMSSGKLLKTLKGHKNTVKSVCFSPDGKYLVSGSYDKTIKIWSVANRSIFKTIADQPDLVNSVCVSPDNKLIAAGHNNGSVSLWSMVSRKLIHVIEVNYKDVFAIVFGPDSKVLFSGGYDGKINLVSIEEGSIIRSLDKHKKAVNTISISPDGKLIASGSADGSICLWPVDGEEPVRAMYGQYNGIKDLSFSPDGKLLASGSYGGNVGIWSVANGSKFKTLHGHTGSVNAVCFGPTGKTVASGGADETIKIWSWSSYEELEPDDAYAESLGGKGKVLYASDRYILDIPASNADELSMRIIDIKKNKIVNYVRGEAETTTAAFVSDNMKYVITGDMGGIVRWVDLEQPDNYDNFSSQNAPIEKIVLLKDNKTIITLGGGENGKIVVSTFPENEPIAEFEGNTLSVSPDGNYLATIESFLTVNIFNLKDHTQLIQKKFWELDGHINCLKFQSVKNQLIVGTTAECLVYDYLNDKIIKTHSIKLPIKDMALNKTENQLLCAYAESSYSKPDKYGFAIFDLNYGLELKKVSLGEPYSRFPVVRYLDDDRILFCDYDRRVNSNILIYKFTDLVKDVILSQCLYDKKELKEGTKGIQYKVGTQTMTLPCGSPIPAGAVCTCNCITVSRPVTTYKNTGSYYTYYYTYTYWYPN